jgi:GNAT superfamily N-acetyltransferase
VDLRDAIPADSDAVARVHVKSWQVAYRGLLPDAYLESLQPEARARRYTFGRTDRSSPQTIVATEGDEILGFATVSPSRDPDTAELGELCALYVEPDHWDRRVGVALVQVARRRLVQLGFTEAILWVLVGNDRATRFYQKDGWCLDGTRRSDVVWGAAVDEVRMRRSLA